MSFSVIGQANTTSSATITIPSGGSAPQAGDLIVIVDTKVSTTGLMKIPVGYSRILSMPAETRQTYVFGRISDGTEGGTSVTGSGSSSFNSKHVIIYRDSRGPITDVIIKSPVFEHTTGDPAAQVIPTGSSTSPLIAMAIYSSNGAVTPSFSPASDGNNNQTASSCFSYVYWKFYTASWANITVDMADTGNNILASFYLEPQVGTIPAWTIVGANSSTDTANVTVPSCQAGDLIVWSEGIQAVTSTAATPSGFTSIAATATELGATDAAVSLAVKLATGSEGGTSIHGSNTSTFNAQHCVVLRYPTPISAISVQDPASENIGVGTAPANQTINASGSTKQHVSIAMWTGQFVLGDSSFDKYGHGSVNVESTCRLRMGWRFDTPSTSQDIVASMLLQSADTGRKGMASGYVDLTTNVSTTVDMTQGTYTLTGRSMAKSETHGFTRGIYALTAQAVSGGRSLLGVLSTGIYVLTSAPIIGGVLHAAIEFGSGVYTLTGQAMGVGHRVLRRVLDTGYYVLTQGWHSPLFESGSNTTNRRVNRKWWAKLLNGGN